MSEHDFNDMPAAQALGVLAGSLKKMLAEGDTPATPESFSTLGDVGTSLWVIARATESERAQMLSVALAGVACCIAGLPRGKTQEQCQEHASRMLAALRYNPEDN